MKRPIAKPWERQTRESEESFSAWLIYRDLAEKRSLELVAQASAKAIPTIKAFSSRWGWVERAREWDNHLLAERDRVRAKFQGLQEKRRLKLIRANYEAAQKLREKALQMLAFPLRVEKVTKDGLTVHIHPARWQFSTAAELLRLSNELESASLVAGGTPVDQCNNEELKEIVRAADSEIREIVEKAEAEGE